MPTAIPELIAQELIARLQTITTANGFAFDVADVSRVNRDATDWTPKHHSIVVVQAEEIRKPEHDYPGNPAAIAYTLPFELHGFVRQSDRAATSDQQKVNEVQAAIKKAVAGTSDWHTFDDNSYLADWGPTSNYNSTEHGGTTLNLEVHYRISDTDPFTVR